MTGCTTNQEGAGKTAVLVVHGIGQHNKYDTLADFSAGLLQSLGEGYSLPRVLRPIDGSVESVLRIGGAERQLDIFEFYYQPQLQRTVSGSDVAAFVFETSLRVRRLYQQYDFPSKETALRQQAAAGSTADDDLLGWHYMLGHRDSKIITRLAIGAAVVWSGLSTLFRRRPWWVDQVLRPVTWLGSRWINENIMEVFGDLVAYLAINPKARLNSKRAVILEGCAERIKLLLGSEYDRVIVAAHSLGSVVAYDALSYIAREAVCGRFDERACDKLQGFVTFGSPLDKVAFVFWPSADSSAAGSGTRWDVLREEVYAGMLPHFYGMRSSTVARALKSPVQQPAAPVFDDVRWVNYYCDRDLVSGHLDAYDHVDNRKIGTRDTDISILKAVADHSVYWSSSEMFDELVADFLPGAAVPKITADAPVARLAQDDNEFFARKQRPLILGHRGVPLHHQENTLAGFRKALELGVDGVEFDVFKTRDGKIVVFHDEDTERLTGVRGNITQMTWDEVSQLRIQRRVDMGNGRVVEFPDEQRIPLLEEVLDEFNGKLLMNIEMKAYAPNWSRRHTGTEVARIIRRCRAMHSVIITSFDFFMLYYLEREFPGLHSGFAYDDGMMENAAGEWLRRFPELSTDLAQAIGNQNDLSFLNFVLEANAVGRAIGSTLVDVEYTLIDSDTVDKFHARNMLVGAYTVFPLDTRYARYPDDDQEAVVRRLMERGVDWLETDDPVRVLELYARTAR